MSTSEKSALVDLLRALRPTRIDRAMLSDHNPVSFEEGFVIITFNTMNRIGLSKTTLPGVESSWSTPKGYLYDRVRAVSQARYIYGLFNDPSTILFTQETSLYLVEELRKLGLSVDFHEKWENSHEGGYATITRADGPFTILNSTPLLDHYNGKDGSPRTKLNAVKSTFSYGKTVFTFVNVHLPVGSQMESLNFILSQLGDIKSLIMIGDFNLTPDKPLFPGYDLSIYEGSISSRIDHCVYLEKSSTSSTDIGEVKQPSGDIRSDTWARGKLV